jgi:CheY-like chemotaxis protein
MSEEQPEQAAGEMDDGVAGGGEPKALLVVDPDEIQRGLLEELEPDLPLRVTSIDPANLLAELENMGDAGAVIVAWDLGGRSGLELVESLIRDPRTAGARFALASEAPTRGMVQAALRAGATGFLFRPYAAEAVGRFVTTGAEAAGASG